MQAPLQGRSWPRAGALAGEIGASLLRLRIACAGAAPWPMHRGTSGQRTAVLGWWPASRHPDRRPARAWAAIAAALGAAV